MNINNLGNTPSFGRVIRQKPKGALSYISMDKLYDTLKKSEVVKELDKKGVDVYLKDGGLQRDVEVYFFTLESTGHRRTYDCKNGGDTVPVDPEENVEKTINNVLENAEYVLNETPACEFPDSEYYTERIPTECPVQFPTSAPEYYTEITPTECPVQFPTSVPESFKIDE